MDEKRFLIEVLLRARETVSQVAQRASRALNVVADAQMKNIDAARGATEQVRQQVTELERQVEGHVREKRALEDSSSALGESSRALRNTAAERRAAANESRRELESLQRQAGIERANATEREKRDIEEVRRIRRQVAEREASDAERTRAFTSETRDLRRQATLLEAINRENAASNQRRAAQLGVEIAEIRQRAREQNRAAVAAEQAASKEESAFNKASSAVDKHSRTLERSREQLSRTREELSRTESDLNRTQESTRRSGSSFNLFRNAMERVRGSSNNTRTSLRGLNAEFQGFQIALAIKYAQSLISALIALGAQLVAVAAAAAQAGIGIGAALAAGAAQAVPVIGLLAAAFSRFTAVMKVAKLENQQQLTATHDAARAAKAQQTATDQITSAEQRVAEAHRTTARAVHDLAQARDDAARQELQAQQAVNQARQDAIRTVQDLMAAEEDAAQSLEQAREGRQRAIESGDVSGTVQADIDVTRSRVTLQRAREDAAPVRAQGVEGVAAVQQAEQQLADTRRSGARQIQQAEQQVSDARRSENQATQDLTRTRREANASIAEETAATDKLADARAQLSDAERHQLDRLLALQATYKRVVRPITDILTNAFTGVIDRINQLIQDPRIIRGFRDIAVQIASSIRTATREASGPRSIGTFQILSAEATRNIPIATRILVNFFRAARNLVLDAVPAFRLLLRYVEDYSGQALDASRNSRGISEFFITGVRYARSFFELGLAVVRLLLAIAGRGGAAGEGIRTINDLTGVIDGLTAKANRNAGAIRRFFRGTHDAFFEILSVLGTLASTMASAFSPSSVSSFADFLNLVIIPAIGNTVKVMGALVTVFHQFLSLPGVAQVAEIAATFLLLARGMTVIRTAVEGVMQIIPSFLRAFGLATEEIVGMTAAGEAVTATVLAPLGIWVLAIGAVIAAIILLDHYLHFLGPTWRWLKRAAGDALDWIKGAAQDVADWFSDVWTQGLLYWLRYPFVKAFEFLRDHGVFRWIYNAARDVVGFITRTFGPGGSFAIIGDVFTTPFRIAAAGLRISFRIIRGIITGALDLIAGRFGAFGDLMDNFWAGFLDVGRGAISSLLGIVGDLLGALGAIPELGGPFKDAASDIRDAQHAIDDLRDKTRDQRKEQERANNAIKDAAPTLVTLRKRYDDARDRVAKLTPGTEAYKDAVIRARKAHNDYNEKLRDTASRSRDAQNPVKRLRSNIANLGGVSADTADTIAKNLNDILRQVGARTIRLNTRAYRRSGIDVITQATGHGATGGALHRVAGIRRRMFDGGIANPYGSASDDHMVVAPSGQPIAAISGTEGIVNTPQMGVINNALAFTQHMTGMPWGSLNDLWGSGMRHYQTGGGLQPAIRTLSNRLDRMFGLVTTSTTGGGHATNSYHYRGLAADISGTPAAMARASSYLRRSGLTRALLEGIHNPGLSIKNGRPVPPSFWGAGTWADHRNHIHLALQSLTARLSDILDAGGIGRVRVPRIDGLGQDALSRIARGSARTLARAANRYLQRQQARMGGADTRALGADVDVVAAFRRAIRAAGANRKERLALWEAGIVESGLKNLRFGDADSLGALQERASIFGRGHALNPFASATRFLRDAIGRRPYRGSAGMLAADVQRPAAQFRGRYDQAQSQAMRYLQPGGPVKGVIRRPTTTPLPRSLSANILANTIRQAMAPAVDRINNLFGDVTTSLETVASGPLRRSARLALRIRRAFVRITGDGGLLDQMRAQTETLTASAATALQQRQFRIGRRGRPQRLALTDAQVAAGELRGLRAQRGGLGDERTSIQDSMQDAQHALEIARRRGNQKAKDAARAALNNLRTRLDANTTAMAQNAQDQVEAQERFQSALLQAVNDISDRQNSAIDRWSRMARALGQNLDPNAVLGAQMDNMRAQIVGLQNVLARAQRTGNTALADQVSDQIADLNVQIAEAVAQQFQNSIDAVNNTATRSNASLDRQTRIAQLGGQTDFRALQGILGQRGDVLRTQIGGLATLRDQAQNQGNIEQFNNLTDQIEELNTALSENTQAIQDNTDAAFNFTTSQINDAFNFTQGIFSGAQGFFQAISEATGADTSGQQATSLQGIAAALIAQQTGLSQQLASLIGDNGAIGLQGQDLVNYLLSVSTGPALDQIMARLDPTQQASFRDLVSALLGNATATVQNTQALENVVSPDAQSFSSTMWSTFRRAVFTGAGGLLPQYQTTIPTAAIGASVLRSGMMLVHAGENVRPAAVSHNWTGGAGGDTYELNVTTPTQVLDPTDVGRQLAFYRKSQGRR